MQPLDLWTLFVQYVFGGFGMAVIGIGLLLFVIMGILGRISIYTVLWYLAMFLLAMTLGQGYEVLNIVISLSVIIMMIYSVMSYINSK